MDTVLEILERQTARQTDRLEWTHSVRGMYQCLALRLTRREKKEKKKVYVVAVGYVSLSINTQPDSQSVSQLSTHSPEGTDT